MTSWGFFVWGGGVSKNVTLEKKTQTPWICYYYFQFSEVEKLENFFPKSDKFSWCKNTFVQNFPQIFAPKEKTMPKGYLGWNRCMFTLLKEKESLHHVRFRIQFWFELGTNLLGSETITMYAKFNILVSNNYSILKFSFQKIKNLNFF
jgi:hypothetical protein